MRHLGTKIIHTDRLLLRPFVLEDAEAMFRNWASDNEVTKYMTWSAHCDVGLTQWLLQDWCSHYGEKDFYQWAIVPKNQDQPIGNISVVALNEQAQCVEIGYCIGRNWWHQGYTSEALKAVIDFFFREVGANRIQATHDPRNSNSGAVMVKCGMRYEGTRRRAGVNSSGICDVACYGILKEEYEAANSGPAVLFLTDPQAKRHAASRILCQLPTWFGIPQMISEYVQESAELPFWAVYEDPLPVGFAALKQTGDKTAEIYVMGVEPRLHRQGLGRKLVNTLESWAFRHGFSYLQVKTVRMGTYEEYDRTNRFYRALGFRELECFPTLWDPHNPCQIYIKAIGGPRHDDQ